MPIQVDVQPSHRLRYVGIAILATDLLLALVFMTNPWALPFVMIALGGAGVWLIVK
jgi:hypothetical protein